jgi:D-tyrosyl-tRNA(Tyr) deacylase
MKKEILLLFCTDRSRDPVAYHVWNQCIQMHTPTPCHERTIEEKPTLVFQSGEEHDIYLAETSNVVSHDYQKYCDDLNRHFSSVDLIAIVNWHQGQNAPTKIFCAHTTADVPTGVFGPASPLQLTGILKALEEARQDAGLMDWRTLAEASHWSGMMYGDNANRILKVQAPVIDVEIGSEPVEWNNPMAHKAVSSTLGKILEYTTRLNSNKGTKTLTGLSPKAFEQEFRICSSWWNKVVGRASRRM